MKIKNVMMDPIDKNELYDRIEAEEEMSDAEKRECYFANIHDEEIEQEW